MNKRKTVIIYGNGEIARIVLQRLRMFSQHDNYCCCGIIVDKDDKRKWWDDTVPLLGISDNLADIAKKYRADELVIAHSFLECNRVL